MATESAVPRVARPSALPAHCCFSLSCTRMPHPTTATADSTAPDEGLIVWHIAERDNYTIPNDGFAFDDIRVSRDTDETVTIVSEHGPAIPSPGIHTNPYAFMATNVVESPVQTGGTQYVCVGWSLTGNWPPSGETNLAVFVHTNDAVLTWNWRTQFWLTVEADAHGQATPASQWVPSGSGVMASASADTYFHFTNWSGSATGIFDQAFVPVASNLPATPPLNVYTDAPGPVSPLFYRISVDAEP